MAKNSTANTQQNENEISQNVECKETIKDYSTFFLYDIDEMTKHLACLTLATFTPSVDQELYCIHKEIPAENFSIDQTSLSISRTMTCSVCNTIFANRNEQILHYKLDWHRFNIKLKLQGEKSVPESEFDEVAGDISSLSGSDSSSDDEISDYDANGSDNCGTMHHRRPSVLPSHVKVNTRRRRLSSATSTDTETEDSECVEKNIISQTRLQPKLYFKNETGKIIALYRCVVHGKENTPQNEHDLLSRVIALPNQMNWAVILIGGGHFAAAIYNQCEIILHKTFHRYTVRAKQGSSQGTRDGKHGGTQPKSVGASLRRHNEAALIKDIQDLMSSWNTELQKCSCIFYRAPSFNRVTLFGGKNPPFKKDDSRLRNIPFPTRRATFKEVQRVFRLLSTLECFGERSDTDRTIPQSPKIHLGHKKTKKYSDISSSEKVSAKGEKLDSDKSVTSSPKYCMRVKETMEHSNLSSPNKVIETDNKSELFNTKKEKPKKLMRRIKQESPETLKANTNLSENCTSSCTSDSEDSIKFELVEEHIVTTELKEMDGIYRRKPYKKKTKSLSLGRRQQDPSEGMLSDERYNIKNALFFACRSGDLKALEKLLNILKNDSYMNSPDPGILISQTDICDVRLSEKLTETDKSALVQHFDVKDAALCVQSKDSMMENNRLNSSSNNTGQYEKLGNSYRSSCQEIDLVLHITSEYAVSSKESANTKMHQKCNKNCETNDNEIQLDNLTLKILNDSIGDSGATMLHVATKEGHQQAVRMLLEYGADPTARDKRGLTPYMTSNNQEMRNEYRRFMAENPDRFDYNKAQIPSPLTEEMQKEKMERRKQKKKLKKEKLKEKKVAELQKKLEDDEKKRFLSLSDREKRALSAEKRYVKQLSAVGEATPVLSRCFQCGENITGKVPFEYNNNCFCSVKCVKDHRKDNKRNIS